jgi:hypothetical protein
MTLPTNAFGVAALVILLLPGIVWTTVRTAVRGRLPDDRDVAGRVLQAVVVSTVLDTFYLLLLGNTAVKAARGAATGRPEHPRLAALTVLVLAVIIPAGLAYLAHARPTLRPATSGPLTRGRLAGRRFPLPALGHEPTPTAWDKAAPSLGGHWIRVRLDQGKWIGGWYGNRSFVSTYPEPRDLYIEDQHHVDADGTIGPQVDGTAGVWLAIKDDQVVEWIRP